MLRIGTNQCQSPLSKEFGEPGECEEVRLGDLGIAGSDESLGNLG